MDTGCIEIVVNSKSSTLVKFAYILLIMLTAAFALLGMAAGIVPLIFAIACGVGAYFVGMNTQVDYEYSLVDKELRVAKIMKKSRRKDMGKYDLEKLEILAPAASHELDSYNHRQNQKELDFSRHDPEEKESKYNLFLEGGTKLVLTLDGDDGKLILDNVRAFAPRKVYRY